MTKAKLIAADLAVVGIFSEGSRLPVLKPCVAVRSPTTGPPRLRYSIEVLHLVLGESLETQEHDRKIRCI